MIDQSRLLDTLRAFITAPSPQDDPESVRAFIRETLVSRLPLDLFDAWSIDEDGNLLAGARLDGARQPLLLCAYGATFPAETMKEAYVPRDVDGAPYGIDGPAIQGRGVTEQVAALAALVEALQAIASEGADLVGGLRFVTTIAGEMGSHEVVDRLAQHGELRAGMALVAAGTSNAVCLGNLGRVDVFVDVRGRSCHSSDPARGLNAIAGARAMLDRLARVTLHHDADLGSATLTATRLETSPKAMHTVPDLAQVILDRRLVPGDEVDEAVEEIAAIGRDLQPYQVEVRSGRFNYPNKVPADAPVAHAALQALSAVTGAAPVTYWRAALDAGYFTRHGVPAVMFGPGEMRLAHTDYELVSVREVTEAAEVYRRFILDACAAS